MELRDKFAVSHLLGAESVDDIVLTHNYKKSCGQISFTMDIWSSASLSPYLAVTSHWIARDGDTNNNLSLKATLIGFHHFTGPHMGKSIASVILSLMDHANITSKVCNRVSIPRTLLKTIDQPFHS